MSCSNMTEQEWFCSSTLKQKNVRLGNNLKNVTTSIMNSENTIQAVSCYNGLFSDAELTIQGFSVVNYLSSLHSYINENFSLSNSFVDSINYKGIHYSNVANHSILLYSEKEKNFGVGIIKKIVIKEFDSEEGRFVFIDTET